MPRRVARPTIKSIEPGHPGDAPLVACDGGEEGSETGAEATEDDHDSEDDHDHEDHHDTEDHSDTDEGSTGGSTGDSTGGHNTG